MTLISTTWSYKITWQTKNIGSPLSQCLWSQKLARWWNTMKSLHSQNHMTLWSSGLARSGNKLARCLCPTTWQDGDLPWGTSIHKITWFFNHIVMQDYVTLQNISPLSQCIWALSQCIWPPNLTGCWHKMRSHHLSSYFTEMVAYR